MPGLLPLPQSTGFPTSTLAYCSLWHQTVIFLKFESDLVMLLLKNKFQSPSWGPKSSVYASLWISSFSSLPCSLLLPTWPSSHPFLEPFDLFLLQLTFSLCPNLTMPVSLSSFRSQLKCHFLRQAFFDTPLESYSPSLVTFSHSIWFYYLQLISTWN